VFETSARGVTKTRFCETKQLMLRPTESIFSVAPARARLGAGRVHVIPIFKRGWPGGGGDGDGDGDRDGGNRDDDTPPAPSDVDSSSQTTAAATTTPQASTPAPVTTQDIVADWEGTVRTRDGTPTTQASPWFGGDTPFTVALIVGLSVISTLFVTSGVSKMKQSKASRGLRERVRVDAPVVPRPTTAERYPTGWQSFADDADRGSTPYSSHSSYPSSAIEPSYSTKTMDAGREYAPLRTPEGERARLEYLEREREKVQDFQNRVDSIGTGADRFLEDPSERSDDEVFGMLETDDYAKGSRMSFREMKERANKASRSASRAAAHAHAASVAATIASEACNEATAAAHRALEASLKTQRALERASGQHIMEIYEATKKEEALAEKRARVAAESSARGLTEGFKAGKASRKACDAADATRPRGLDAVRAMAADAKAAAVEGRDRVVVGAGVVRDVVVSGWRVSGNVASHAVSSGRDAVGNLKERLASLMS